MTSAYYPPPNSISVSEVPIEVGVKLSKCADVAARNEVELLDVADATVLWYRSAVARLQRYLGRDIDIGELTPRLLADWQESLADETEGLKVVTQNNYVRGIKAVCGRLHQLKKLPDNPARYLKEKPEEDGGPKAISKENYKRLRAVADVRDRAIIDILWESGCRRGGLCSLSVYSVEIWKEKGEYRAALKVVEKGEKPRTVYVGSRATKSLMAWLAARPKVAHNSLWVGYRKEALQPNGVTQMLLAMARKAGIPEDEATGAHSFRHAWAIRMLEEGYDLAFVSKVLGHKSPEFTAKVYVRRREEQLRAMYFDGPAKKKKKKK
jgi:site-specific recombinase XerD